MTDYATLQSDLAAWSAKSNLTTLLPSFIRNAEARIGRAVRTLDMQQRTTLVVPDTGEVALPARFLGFRSVSIQVSAGLSNSARIDYMAPDPFDELLIDSSLIRGVSSDSYYTIEGGNIRVLPAPGSGDTMTLRVSFFQRYEALNGTTNTTHNLIADNYDLYLFASLAELYNYLQDDAQEAKYRQLMSGVVDEIHLQERRKARSGPHIRRPADAP